VGDYIKLVKTTILYSVLRVCEASKAIWEK